MIPIHTIVNHNSTSKVEFVIGESKNIPTTAILTFPIINHSEEGIKYVLIQDKNLWWNAVGGHIEEGESSIEALKRESMEECGVIINNIETLGYFLITRVSGENKYPKVSQIPLTISTVQKLEIKGWTLRETLGRGIFTEEEVINLLKSSRSDNDQMLEIFKKYVRKN